ncbi:unnamed protein product, partial [Pocillopora meandrina]
EQDVERDIEKISKTAAKVVLLVAFSVNSFDYLSIYRNLNPLAKHLKLNYNCIKRTEIKSNKSLNFLFDKSPKPSSS